MSFFLHYLEYGAKFAASAAAGARNQVSAPVSPVDEGKR